MRSLPQEQTIAASRDDPDTVEGRLRCELAACFQLVDLYGMSDLTLTHISARIPGEGDRFLINPIGMLFDEITASALVKVDADGKVFGNAAQRVNPAVFVIHSAIHMARHELKCVLHTHTPANNAVAMLEEGLLPLTQKATMLQGFLGHHDYEGVSLDTDERTRIAQDLGDRGRILILRNHGALTTGKTVGEAFVWMYKFEMACRYQIGGLSMSQPLRRLSDDAVRRTTQEGLELFGEGGVVEAGALEWPAMIRKLERERGTSYKD